LVLAAFCSVAALAVSILVASGVIEIGKEVVVVTQTPKEETNPPPNNNDDDTNEKDKETIIIVQEGENNEDKTSKFVASAFGVIFLLFLVASVYLYTTAKEERFKTGLKKKDFNPSTSGGKMRWVFIGLWIFFLILGLTLNLVYMPTTKQYNGIYGVVIFCYLAVFVISILLYVRFYFRLKGYVDMKEDAFMKIEEYKPKVMAAFEAGQYYKSTYIDPAAQAYDTVTTSVSNAYDSTTKSITGMWNWMTGNNDEEEKPEPKEKK
jgi:amino acid transporter